VNLAFLPVGFALLALSAPANAGPPFLTDDPEPVEFQHWEIYAPLFEADGSGKDFEGAFGAEINYGAAPNLQVSLGFRAAFSHDEQGWHSGAGDVEASVKYRIYDKAGLQMAAFPGLTLPTAKQGLGAGKVTALLPVWAQKDMGPWSVFGGGGYAVNPGSGNRDYWTGGVAVTRQVSERLLVGAEIDRQGTDTVGGSASTSVGLGAIYDLPGPLRCSLPAGPLTRIGAQKDSTRSSRWDPTSRSARRRD
jgi:hypothetical protein